jgi:hypothetical protein
MPSARTPDVPPSLTGLRLVQVPADWPPYDCETHGAACPAAGAGAATAGAGAAGAGAAGAGAATAGATAGAATAGAGVSPARASARWPGPTPVSGQAPGLSAAAAPAVTSALSAAAVPGLADGAAAAMWPRRFAQAIVEVLAGTRPARQLAAYTTERVRAEIGLLSRSLAADQRPTIRRIVTSWPVARVVEMTVVLGFGPRSRALAMRLEYLPGRPATLGRPARPARWLCTEIETG